MRQQVVAGGHAGAAHGDHLRGGVSPEHRAPQGCQSGRRLRRRPSAVKIQREGLVACTGHMAGDRIDGLVLAGETVGGARIQQQDSPGQKLLRCTSAVVMACASAGRTLKRPRDARRRRALQAAGPPPARRQDRRSEPKPAHARASAAATTAAPRTSICPGRRPRPGCRQSTPAAPRNVRERCGSGSGCRPDCGVTGRGQVVIQMGEHRAGDMRRGKLLSSPVADVTNRGGNPPPPVARFRARRVPRPVRPVQSGAMAIPIVGTIIPTAL